MDKIFITLLKKAKEKVSVFHFNKFFTDNIEQTKRIWQKIGLLRLLLISKNVCTNTKNLSFSKKRFLIENVSLLTDIDRSKLIPSRIAIKIFYSLLKIIAMQ